MGVKTLLKAFLFAVSVFGGLFVFMCIASYLPFSERWQGVIGVLAMSIFMKYFFNSNFYKWLQAK